MKITRILLGVIVIAFSSYILISRNYELMPFVMLLFGTFMLLSGLVELQKDRKNLKDICLLLFLYLFSLFSYRVSFKING